MISSPVISDTQLQQNPHTNWTEYDIDRNTKEVSARDMLNEGINVWSYQHKENLDSGHHYQVYSRTRRRHKAAVLYEFQNNAHSVKRSQLFECKQSYL